MKQVNNIIEVATRKTEVATRKIEVATRKIEGLPDLSFGGQAYIMTGFSGFTGWAVIGQSRML